VTKKIISVHNNTDKLAGFGVFSPDGGGVTLSPHFKKGNTPWIPKGPNDGSIPVNDDSARYYDANHMEITLYESNPNAPGSEGSWIGNWSLWANNWRTNFTVQYIDGIGWEGRNVHTLRGGNRGGDGTQIKLHISEHPDQTDFYQRFQLTAVAITPAEQAQQTAEAFNNAIPNMGISKQSSKDDLKDALNSAHMQTIKTQAMERGFQSIGLMVGGGGSIVVGGEVCSGFLTGLSGETAGRTYTITSSAVSIGAEEGVTAFLGLYMSSEAADNAGGLEFFSEVGAGLGVGIAYRDFTTWGGEFGQMVMVTTGEELELSVGIGDTVVVGD
jgi:hypothetical protein